MRIYEELFIVRPDATEEEVDALVEAASQTVTNGGGTVDKVEKWGVRKLAYRVAKREEGYYVLMQITSNPEPVKEVERRFRVSDDVLKFLTVRIDKKLKKIEKKRQEREKRAKRKPQAAGTLRPAAVPPAAPAAPGAPVPGAPEAPAPAPAAPETAAAEEPAGRTE
ncbi:MAG: 30S ribosomal protein S6 [bacterium]|jgi:small subunit ribosomal protein S6